MTQEWRVMRQVRASGPAPVFGAGSGDAGGAVRGGGVPLVRSLDVVRRSGQALRPRILVLCLLRYAFAVLFHARHSACYVGFSARSPGIFLYRLG